MRLHTSALDEAAEQWALRRVERRPVSATPRTCCPTHTDRCRFGREHLWAGPFLLDQGRRVDGKVWSHPDDVKCAVCGGECVADRTP